MANPLPNEQELYVKIKKEKLNIPSPIWQLIEHHIGNDAYAITLIAGLHVSGGEKEPIPPEDGEKIIKHCMEIKEFLKKLEDSTKS